MRSRLLVPNLPRSLPTIPRGRRKTFRPWATHSAPLWRSHLHRDQQEWAVFEMLGAGACVGAEGASRPGRSGFQAGSLRQSIMLRPFLIPPKTGPIQCEVERRSLRSGDLQALLQRELDLRRRAAGEFSSLGRGGSRISNVRNGCCCALSAVLSTVANWRDAPTQCRRSKRNQVRPGFGIAP